MSYEKKKKIPSYERYTIFNALLEAMNEKKQKKSRWNRLLHRLRLDK